MEAGKGCGWLVLADAAAYHNAGLDAMVAAMTDAEIEEYGYPEPWYPESKAEATIEVECGAEVVGDRRLCAGHAEAMDMDDREFEAALESGVTWSNDHRPYN